MKPTPDNFLAFWDLQQINNKPIEWYTSHPLLKEHLFLFSDINTDVFALWENLNDPELDEFLMYVSAHAFLLEGNYELDREDAACNASILLEERTKAFCDFFMESIPQKQRSLACIKYFQAWLFTVTDEWENELETERANIVEKVKHLPVNYTVFIQRHYDSIKEQCYMEL